ncbi:unnamed protein product [Alopecurus aequalis]
MKSAMVDWSSLPWDLIRGVADCLLATNDIDYYMDMRAVCCGWRAAMADPCRHGTDANFLLFRPRQWIMLDDDSEDEHRLFVNISTGRFLRWRLPLLRDHIMVSTSDGLIILLEKKRPHAAHVLNPLTGSLIRFAMPIPHKNILMSVVTGSDPTLVFYKSNDDDDILRCADPTSKTFSTPLFLSGASDIQSILAYAGNVYAADVSGSLFKMVGTAQHCYCELIAKISNPREMFLVESAGELLLIILSSYRLVFEILRVDVKRNMLEAVKSMGTRALFLGPRSLSVDADKLPSLDRNCLYYHVSLQSKPGMYMYDLRDGTESSLLETTASPFHRQIFSRGPTSLVQVLLGYCLLFPGYKAQLMHLLRTRED